MAEPFVVMKFGGTSVKGRAEWDAIAEQVNAHRRAGNRPVVVCSAVSQMTNALERLLVAISTSSHDAVIDEIETRHLELATALGLDFTAAMRSLFEDLRRLCHGAALIDEVSPRLRARILSFGELMSTQIGAHFLSSVLDEPVEFLDARQALTTESDADDPRAYLSATCAFDYDEALVKTLNLSGASVFITQGFIASRPDGRTAVLGRGGSDTSAAYFAARLGASVCEIWTDVPGVFSANPKDVPGARLLKVLDFAEAQEIATMGAKVLHPRCLLPLRSNDIPVRIRCTHRPDMNGTQIRTRAGGGEARVKAIIQKRGVTLVSMNTLGMWQQVGFLADTFAVFKEMGLSIDLVSTSEANVTCSIDSGAATLTEQDYDALKARLAPYCQVSVIRDCAAISLVGRHIRAILHKLGPALSVFEERRIHLVSQAASDLNFTFVVDAEDADRLVTQLHALLFAGVDPGDKVLGETWQAIFNPKAEEVAVDPLTQWWRNRRSALLETAQDATAPIYVYDEPTLHKAATSLMSLKSVARVFYAIKANPHPDILRLFTSLGMGLECVSPGELERAFSSVPELSPERVLFTPNFARPSEYAAAFERGVFVNVDNLSVVEQAPDIFRGREIFLRLDPGKGRGHHRHVRTAGAQSKFGIAPEDLDRAATLLAAHDVRVIGLHAHAGSGIRTPNNWTETALFLLDQKARFPDVKHLDLGGGLGIVEKPGQAPLDLSKVDDALLTMAETHPDVELWIEPGRFLVARAGVLLCTVTQTKNKGDVRYVGVDAGMHTLIRPALYGAYHEIVNLTRLDEDAAMTANVVGPICESGDTLGQARHLPKTLPGDVMLVATAGAYGMAMHSDYNLRARAEERLLSE